MFALIYSMSLTRMCVRHGIPGGPDGRPRPCPVGPRRRPGGHHYLLLAQRQSTIVWKGTGREYFFLPGQPQRAGG